MSNEKKVAGQLEAYLNSDAKDEGMLDPATRQVATSLLQAANAEQPRPGFVNELAGQLKERNQEMKRQTSSAPSRLLRLAFSGVGLVALIAVAAYAAGLFRAPQLEPAAGESETPQAAELFQPDSGPLAGHQLRLTAALPDAPRELQRYEASAAFQPPDDIAEAQALGRALGLQNPDVYESPQSPGFWIVRDENGVSLSFQRHREGGPTGLHYSNNPQPYDTTGGPLPFEEAANGAVGFLEQVGLLPAEYLLEEEATGGSGAVRLVKVIPVVDGLPIVAARQPTTVGITPDGVVAHAHIFPLATAALDASIEVRPARQALDNLLAGRGGYSFSFEHILSEGQRQRIYFPPHATPSTGQTISTEGWLQILRSLSDGHVEVTLNSWLGVNYQLAGVHLDELASAENTPVQVEGIVVEERDNGLLVLEVSRWQPASTSPPVQCLTGFLALASGSMLLQADDGGTFDLGEPVVEIPDGQRVEVCAGSFDEEVVAWQRIAMPPSVETGGGSSGVSSDAGSGSGAGSSGGALTAAEVTREGQVESSETVPAGGDPSLSPFAAGDEVTVRGLVGGFMERDGDDLIPHLLLAIDADDDPFTPRISLALYGPQALIAELSGHYRAYVEVQGIVVEAGGELPLLAKQAIQVDSFKLLEGAQGVQAFLGHMERQTVDGRDMSLFVDEETGERYILTTSHSSQPSRMRTFVAGVVHPHTASDGLPLLEPISIQSGSEVDAAESPAEIVQDTQLPLMDGPASPAVEGLPQALVIEGIELVYQMDGGAELVPAWRFTGRSEDGQTIFEFLVPAAP